MEYTELNIIQKNRMKQICTNSYTMEWENPEFMDSLMGKLPEIIITDKDRNITNELVELVHIIILKNIFLNKIVTNLSLIIVNHKEIRGIK